MNAQASPLGLGGVTSSLSRTWAQLDASHFANKAIAGVAQQRFSAGADHCFANAARASAMAFLKFAVLSPVLTRNVPMMKAGVPRNPNAAVWS